MNDAITIARIAITVVCLTVSIALAMSPPEKRSWGMVLFLAAAFIFMPTTP